MKLSTDNPLSKLLGNERLNHPVNGRFWYNFQYFLSDYYAVISKDNKEISPFISLFIKVISLIDQQMNNPHDFPIYHRKQRSPVDYYKLGIDMITPLIDQEKSTINDLQVIENMHEQLLKNENVIIFANHQTEVEPQIISIMLEKTVPSMAGKISYIAGDRVTSDPLAAPFSAGVDLFCIYSKKYITEDNKEKISAHNKKTIQAVRKELNNGGLCLYIACSGGRDRRDSKGHIFPSLFDPSSIDLMYLLGERATQKTHYYPLSLFTSPILPPPNETNQELGERRTTSKSPVHIYFSAEIDMKNIHSHDTTDKKHISQERAKNIYKMVVKEYENFTIPK